MTVPKVALLADTGTSITKYLLWREPSFATAHCIPASCTLIDQDSYEYESKHVQHQWGAGVVSVPTVDGIRFYRVGEDPVTRTSQEVSKWQAALSKILCALGSLSLSSTSELPLVLQVLLPVDEFAYRMPLFVAIKYALTHGVEVNGRTISNIKIVDADCLPEGAGLISESPSHSAGLMCGHCDLSFLIGRNSTVDLAQSFSIPGGGAILPLRLSGLPILGSEVEAAGSFTRKRWKDFAQDGLTVSDVTLMADEALEKYPLRITAYLENLSKTCRANGVSQLLLAGGSAPVLKEILRTQKALKVTNTRQVEQLMAEQLELSDRKLLPRLVDAYLVWRRIPVVRDFLDSRKVLVGGRHGS